MTKAGFTKISKNLNNETKGDPIYLWYSKKATEFDTPIEMVHVSADIETEVNFFRDSWERMQCDVNRNAGGAWIHIWIKRAKIGRAHV